MIDINFNKEEFQKAVLKKIKLLDEAILSRFQRVGEQFVIDARTNGAYLDQTGNLRSSIGYMVLKNGKEVSKNGFSISGTGGDKATGSNEGNKFIDKVAKDFPSGYVLICVAGMDYAASVESRGKDVITGSSQLAENNVKRILIQILNKN